VYKELALKSNERRPFQITVGLEEGYGGGVMHTVQEVEDLLGEWLELRMKKGEKTVSGPVYPGRLVYAWNTPATGIKINKEPLATIVGEVSPVYCSEYTDDEVKEVLRDLACYIGEKLKQTRMYVAYRDKIWVYGDDKATHPTELLPA
jgi:hypothetical protein